MHIPRLYLQQDLKAPHTVTLPPDKAHHIMHVMRLRIGDTVILFNNTGNEFESRVVDLQKKSAKVEIVTSNRIDRESSLDVTLALAISRGQHMDFAIQKAVELGVNKIIPLTTEYSNVRIKQERLENKMMHWKNIIISATEQSGRNRLAQLTLPWAFPDWIGSQTDLTCMMLHPGCESTLNDMRLAEKSVTILIGPEGGFSDTELGLAGKNGIIPVSLGSRILRTETAVISILAIVQQKWGDLN